MPITRDLSSLLEGPRLMEALPSGKSIVTVAGGRKDENCTLTFKGFHPEVTCIIFFSYSLMKTSPLGVRGIVILSMPA